jgi:hypothetical protein
MDTIFFKSLDDQVQVFVEVDFLMTALDQAVGGNAGMV